MKSPILSQLTSVFLSRWIHQLFRSSQLRLILLAALAFVGFGGVTKIPGGKGNTLERIASWPELTRGPALDVAITDHYAYVAIGHGGLIILDVADPTHPTRVADYFPPGQTDQVRIEGSRAYLATRVQRGGGCQAEDWRGRLVILDIGDPVNPKPLGEYVTGSVIEEFSVDGHRALIRDGDWGHTEESFRIVDVSDPVNPLTLSVRQRKEGEASDDLLDDPRFFLTKGDQAFITSDKELAILDMRRPDSPAAIANINIPEGINAIQALQMKGTLIYLITVTHDGFYQGNGVGHNTMWIFETSIASAPRLLGSVDFSHIGPESPGSRQSLLTLLSVINQLKVEGNYAYLPMMSSGMAVFNVGDSANPAHVGTWDTKGEAAGVELSQGYAFVADSHHGIQVIDVRDPLNLNQSASYDTGLTPRAAQLSDSRAYLLSGYNARSRIEALDVSNPSRPTLLGTYESEEEIMFFDMIDGLAYIGLRRGDALLLRLLNFRNPTRPELLSEITLGGLDNGPGVPEGYVRGQYAYFTTDGLLQIFDVSDPTQPERLSRINIDRGTVAGGLRVWNNLAYLNASDLLTIINVADPKKPARTGRVDLPESTISARGSGGLSVSSDTTFVGMGFSGFAVVDSRRPNRPRITAYHDTLGEVRDLSVAGDYLYLAEGWEGVEVFDVHDFRRPFSIGRSSTRGKALEIEVTDEYAYVVEASAGLAIFDLKPASIKITQNPASQSIAAGDTATLTVRAYGQEPLGYQWFLGGRGDESQPISGANVPDYTTPPLDEEFSYWVRVTGNAGVMDSQAARIGLVPSVTVELLSLWPNRRGELGPDDTVTDLAVSGHHAFLAVRAGGLKIIDVSNPLQPNLASSYSRNVRHVAADSRYVYVTGDTSRVLDINDPAQPSLVAPLRALGGDVFPNGDFAYLSDGGLKTLDMRNPTQPKVIPSNVISFAEEWEVQGISFSGNSAVVGAAWGGMQILDLSTPAEPKYVGAYYSDTSVGDVAWSGDLACLTLGGALPGLELVDTSDPNSPTPTARISLPFANQVELMGRYACVTGEGLKVYDIADPTQLVLVGSHRLATVNEEPRSQTHALKIADNLVYVAAGYHGLAIYQITPQLILNPPELDDGALRWSWVGGPGILLQRTTNLSNPDWKDVPESNGLNGFRLSPDDRTAFFRLVMP